jgi:hypothetical protein
MNAEPVYPGFEPEQISDGFAVAPEPGPE